jgi:hypothetical protein
LDEEVSTASKPNPIGILYHYTDQRGLLGILDSKSIWATHVRYLNDSSEYKHGLDIVRRLVREFTIDLSSVITGESSGVASERTGAIMREVMGGTLDLVDKMSVFVASFFDSTGDFSGLHHQDAGDNLSQWRAYSKGSAGFSLGFDKEALISHLRQQSDELEVPIVGANCEYREDLQELYLQEKVAEVAPIILKHLNDAMDEINYRSMPTILSSAKERLKDEPSDLIYQQTMEQAAFAVAEAFSNESDAFKTSMLSHMTKLIVPLVFMKHYSFGDEREWRIARLRGERTREWRFRPGKSSLIPYIEIPAPVAADGCISLIKRVVVGPSPEINEAMEAVRMLFESKGYNVVGHGESGGIEIVASKLPYRDW